MPVEHMITAMACLLSKCGNDTVFMENSAMLQPLDDVWGVGCKSKAVDFNIKLDNLIRDQDQTSRILSKLERSINKLQAITDYKADGNRNKREVADNFDVIKYPQFNCNGSVTGLLKAEINAAVPSFLVSCEAEDYGQGWALIASLDATHRKRLHEKSPIEVMNGFGGGFYADNVSEYFIGLERLHRITTSNSANEVHQLLILTHVGQESGRVDWGTRTHFMQYNSFAIADERNDYRLLSLEGYVGDVVDPLNGLLGQPFSIAEMDLEDSAQMSMFVRSVKA